MGKIKRDIAERGFALLMAISILISILPLAASAITGKTEVPGKVYEFDQDSHYEFTDSDTYSDVGEDNTYAE